MQTKSSKSGKCANEIAFNMGGYGVVTSQHRTLSSPDNFIIAIPPLMSNLREFPALKTVQKEEKME